MKRVDTIARVRRAFYVQGWSMKKIVRELHVSRNTVRKILRTDETDFSYERERQPMPRIGPWQGQLEQFLSSNAIKPARERLTLIRIFEELRGLGYRPCRAQGSTLPGRRGMEGQAFGSRHRRPSTVPALPKPCAPVVCLLNRGTPSFLPRPASAATSGWAIPPSPKIASPKVSDSWPIQRPAWRIGKAQNPLWHAMRPCAQRQRKGQTWRPTKLFSRSGSAFSGRFACSIFRPALRSDPLRRGRRFQQLGCRRIDRRFRSCR